MGPYATARWGGLGPIPDIFLLYSAELIAYSLGAVSETNLTFERSEPRALQLFDDQLEHVAPL
jgi:hypothetical protein